MKIEINTFEELASLLGKAYWMESQLELAGQWEAYLTTKNDRVRDLLFRISHESEGHKLLLKRLASNFEDLDLERAMGTYRDRKFDFENLHDEEIFNGLLRNEMIILDLYERLKAHSGKEFIGRIWKGNAPQTFFDALNWLIAQERAHVGLLKPYAVKMDRIH